jgi:Skp family chaperone for outer membrane proteins
MAVLNPEAPLKKRMITSVLLAALFGIGAGCNKEDSSAVSASKATPINPVATVNLETIGKQMGWEDEINKNVRQTDADISADLEPKLKQFKEAFEEKKKEISKGAGVSTEALGGVRSRDDLVNLKLTPKQIDDFLLANANLNQGVQQLNNIGQQAHMQRQQAIRVAYYRDSLQPVIRRVANANNRTIVFTLPNPQVIAFSDASTDMTEKVIDDLQKSPAIKVIIPEFQHIQLTPATGTGPTSAPATQPG